MIDALTRHQILIQRLGRGYFSDIKPILSKMQKDITARISSATSEEFDRLTILLREVNAIIDAAKSDLTPKLTQLLIDFYDYESKFAVNLLDRYTTEATVIAGTALSVEQIAATVTTARMTLDGASPVTLGQLVEQLAGRVRNDVTLQIRAGVVEGQTAAQIASTVNRMISGRTFRQAESVVLTATNHIGTVARGDVWAANADLAKGERYSATLDSRTTLICASLDGQIFPIGQGPKPPLHFRCRSIRVLELKDEYKLKRDRYRQSVDGPVIQKTTFGDWLKRQDKAFQVEVLGVERQKLFASGQYEIRQFVDPLGRTYTLKELAAIPHA